jgi:hypothetical protein
LSLLAEIAYLSPHHWHRVLGALGLSCGKSLGEDAEDLDHKLNPPIPQALKRLPRDIARMKKGDLAVVSSVRIVDDFIRTMPKGA